MKKVGILLFVFFFMFNAGVSSAQENILDEYIFEEENEGLEYPEEETVNLEYNSGEVISIDKKLNKTTIREYDWENDINTDVTYSISPNVKVRNVDSWTEIPVGSQVEIGFIRDDKGERIAQDIIMFDE